MKNVLIMKKFILIIVSLILLLCISCSYASDNNSFIDESPTITQDNTLSSNIEQSTTDYSNSEEITSEYSDESDSYEEENDCCTNVLQVSANESVISFRRDTYSDPINIIIGNNSTHVYQYKTANGYFQHITISKDGWLFGTGGARGTYLTQILAKGNSMRLANKITTADLNYIASLHRRSGFGHFLIKAPDGRYGAEIYRDGTLIRTGTLKNGEFIVCPNSIKNYIKGDYVSYTKTTDVVKASRLVALKDKYGVYRRNVMTYHYTNNLTESKVDFYVCNDDGSRVGVQSSRFRDNIVTFNRTISNKVLPTSADGMFVQSYVFKHPTPKISFTVSSDKKTAVMGDKITFNAKLSYDNKAVNNGYVIFKINGVTVKDNKNQMVKAYLKNGIASYTYTIPDGWSAREFKLSSVYSRNDFGRIENTSKFNLRRSNISIDNPIVKSTNNTLSITGRISDEHGHNVKGNNVIAIKIDGITIKNYLNQTRYFTIQNGVIHMNITLDNLLIKEGSHSLTITTGTRAGYNSLRQNIIFQRS